VAGVTVLPVTVAPLPLAGVGWTARPTLAPAWRSPSSELMANSVFLGVIPSAASRLKKMPQARL
jgi:hypothetical protein